jgi:hypothetical protein
MTIAVIARRRKPPKQSPRVAARLLRGLCPLAMTAFPCIANAQSSPWLRLGANGVLLYTYADPVPRNRDLAEVRLVQPAIMVHGGAFGNRLRFLGTLDLEGLTIPNGELTPGTWGEGFVDRRHPHTYLHELMLTGEQVLGERPGGVRVSLSFGKGFAPFGTDDPMSRPIVRYPVNHHLAQILERAVVIADMSAGPFILEGGLFNGDEPERPGGWPRLSRFGDSWAGRLTVLPVGRLELQGSYANVHSPEHRQGSGTEQHKASVSARLNGALGAQQVYGLAEWARTSEAEGALKFHSLLAEGAWSRGISRLYYRYERTERPEEQRTLSPFRSIRPHFENSIQGITLWTIHTAGYGFRVTSPKLRLTGLPFAEVSYGRVTSVGGGLFDPRTFYGKTSFWALSMGVRLTMGMPMHRMGHYGMAQDTAATNEAAQDVHHDH